MLRLSRSTIATIVAAVVVVCALCGYLYVKNGDSLDFSDTQTRIVISGSMDGEPRDQYEIPTIPVGSMVFISETPTNETSRNSFYASLEVGDVVTFNYIHPASHERMVVTHRIIDILSVDDHYTYTLKGDSIADDPTNGSVQVVTSDSGDIIGKVTGVAPWLGQLVVFLSTWEGKVSLVLIPCAILIAYEVVNIIRNIRKPEGSE